MRMRSIAKNIVFIGFEMAFPIDFLLGGASADRVSLTFDTAEVRPGLQEGCNGCDLIVEMRSKVHESLNLRPCGDRDSFSQ